MPLSDIFSNRLDDLVNCSDKKDVISHHQNRNTISPQLSATGRDRVTGHFEPKERMEGAKGDTSDVSLLYRGIIKCN